LFIASPHCHCATKQQAVHHLSLLLTCCSNHHFQTIISPSLLIPRDGQNRTYAPYTVYDRVFGSFPAQIPYTHRRFNSGQPCSYHIPTKKHIINRYTHNLTHLHTHTHTHIHTHTHRHFHRRCALHLQPLAR